MRAKIRAEKVASGYLMIVILPSGEKEYPQEGKIHPTRQNIYTDASIMYASSVWDYRESDHTILID